MFKYVKTIKVVVFLFCLLPLGIMVYDGFQRNLTADPIDELLHRTGIWSLRLLLLTLAMTPLKILTGQVGFIRFRRMLGLFTFFYATLHLIIYTWLDLGLAWGHLWEDIVKRPYITVGMLAWLLMLPMAVTSNRYMIRKMGKKWKRLHQTIYLVIGLACLHFIWLVKSDITEPLIYLLIGLILLLIRIIHHYYGQHTVNQRKFKKGSNHTA
ncbi:sulfoxide reductase heme-binding subunit YedZ [Marinicella sp. S1101]|uniref:sulfite oxidase heme-binding subunit YedZ n=1 Tax=Marinicella marina TaxID=2996016 RepID=UPI002260F75D|nr:protein-methionine-sulfoxide reductase heme-binding subunit MsrQ [Marinicella marina]MCX7553447.1 sulfoxide reductase heme-binding subunit YedZ [Marinicella marina]MDJ1140071.1 protein-methionine-sulfoxide reductase heme-binding subunit MsrQ [Marinicella marina]